MTGGVGAQIRKARQEASLTQDALARLAGVSRPTVARVEAGMDVSASSIEKMAAVFGFTLCLRAVC